jgi:CSLREA domain-containing protein
MVVPPQGSACHGVGMEARVRRRFDCAAMLPLVLGGLALLPVARAAWGVTFTVNSTADISDGTCDATDCSLREAIEEANASAGSDTIVFDLGVNPTINLGSDLPQIDGDLDIQGVSAGTAVTVNGAGAHRIFYARAGVISISELTVQSGLAKGGDGGNRAGGGLGAGGGLFVDVAADVTLTNVRFDDTGAQGGDGGPDGSPGGGGGLAGNGGNGSPVEGAGGGGGGAFEGDDGADAVGFEGGDGGGTGGGAGGAEGVAGSAGVSGAGGGGGGASSSGDGGAGGSGGPGGGGGGGGTPNADGGDGDFGGGGGGASGTGLGGQGGFGGGDGTSSGQGDGGSAFGGAVFVRSSGGASGSLTIVNPRFGGLCINDASCVVAGSGARDGEARGSVAYIGSGVDLILDVPDANDASDISGTVSGEGRLVKTGDGELRLMPPPQESNDYSGGTDIQAGTLFAFYNGISGDVDVAGGATLLLNVGPDFSTGELQPTRTFTIAVDGDGRLVKNGAGTAILDGSTSHTGGTVVENGTLQGDTQALQGTIDLAPDPNTMGSFAALVFDVGGSESFDDGEQVLGDGDVTLQGGGELTLGGQFAHTGSTFVDDAVLRLLDRGVGDYNIVASDVVVEPGSVLAGDGRVQTKVTASSGGSVAPGLSASDDASTLFAGSVDFQAGSVLAVNVTAALGGGSSSSLDVSGAADVASGASVDVNLLGGSLAVGESETYTILSAGALNGLFGTVTDSAFFFDTSLSAMNQMVLLTVTRNDNTLEDVATTPNQRAVATVLGNSRGMNADLDSVIAQIEVLPEDEFGPAFDSLGGEGITSFTTPQLLNADKAARTTMARLGIVGGRSVGSPGTIEMARRMGDASTAGWLFADTSDAGAIRVLASAPPVSTPPPEQRRWGTWLDGYGLFGNVDGNGNSATADWTVAGALGGVDVRLGQHGLVGLGGGYASIDTSVDNRDFDGDVNVYQALLYGGYVGERFYLGALGRYAYDDFGSSRGISFGALDRKARGDFDGQEAGAYVEAGVVAISPGGVQLEPMASFHYTWLERDGFTESGADSVDLEVDQDSWNSLLGTLGVRVHKRFMLERDLSFVPELWVRYAHQFGDRDRHLDARFSGAPGGGEFRVTGAEAGREGAILGVGWSVQAGRRLSAFLYYDASLSQDLIGHAVAGGFLARW